MGAFAQLLLANKAIASAGDPNWASRIALPNFEGPDGSTSILDHTGLNTWTCAGDAQLDTTRSRSGGSSLLLDGTGDWVQASDSAPWAFGTADWFVEASIYVTTLSTGVVRTILSQWGSLAGDRAFILFLSATGNLTFTVHHTGGSSVTASSNTIVAGAWNDIAAGRIGNTIYVWVGGIRSATTGNISTNGVANPSSVIRIGADSNGNSRFTGWIDQLRASVLSPPSGDYTVALPFPTGP